MKISIITINKNNELGLLKTIQSVIIQIFSDYEYIIIDGASIDKSVELIKKYESNINFWISEPDKGIYNAMNKGIDLASGDYIYFLNSGDVFAESTSLNEIFTRNFTEDFIFCNIIEKFGKKEYKRRIPSIITFNYLYRYGICHQATFTKKTLFKKMGKYDETKLSSDWKFLILGICKFNCNYVVLDIVLSIYDTSGISSTSVGDTKIKFEKKETLKDHFSMFVDDYERYNKLNRFTYIGILNIFQLNIRRFFIKLNNK